MPTGDELSIHVKQATSVEMPNQIDTIDGYQQALFSAGDQPVVMHFEDSPSDLNHLRDAYPRHRFYSVDVKKAKEVAKHCHLEELESPHFKIFKEGE